MTDLMTIKLLSPDISDFDPLPSVHQWNQSAHKARRPTFGTSKDCVAESSISDATNNIPTESPECISDYESEMDSDTDSLFSEFQCRRNLRLRP